MNEREAARLIDYGHTEVTVKIGGQNISGVAVRAEMLPTLTVRLADGTEVSAPLEDCNLT